tara:strand:+ start:18302 stop:19759 length:1458 start_codon:yes stop_codon:yes gene_type:complete
MVNIDLSGLAVNRRHKMGRPPDCHCHCGDVVPPPPDFDASFFVLVLQDESNNNYVSNNAGGGNGQGNFEPDLIYLREKEQTLGRVNMAILQPGLPGWGVDSIKAESFNGNGPQGLPVEVLYYSTCSRNTITSDDRTKLTHITNELIRGNYQCIGVFIDTSGSMNRSTVAAMVDEWYWNISTDEASHATYTRYIVDTAGNPWPLPSCTSDKLGLGTAGGCVMEIGTGAERWLKIAADNAQSIFDHPEGCTGASCCSTKSGWPEICAVTSDVTETPTTVNFNVSWIQAGTETQDDENCITLEDQFGNVTTAEFKAEILEAMAVWKETFEDMCSWLTVTFTDIGDETGITVPSDSRYGNYNLPHNYNLGDIRVGMHLMEIASTLAHAWAPDGVLGAVGNYGGDVHFDSADSWRKDNESVTGASSIKWTAVHELGHVFGLPHNPDENAIMYYEAPSEIITGAFDTTYPNGVIGSTTDYNAVKELYCVPV